MLYFRTCMSPSGCPDPPDTWAGIDTISAAELFCMGVDTDISRHVLKRHRASRGKRRFWHLYSVNIHGPLRNWLIHALVNSAVTDKENMWQTRLSTSVSTMTYSEPLDIQTNQYCQWHPMGVPFNAASCQVQNMCFFNLDQITRCDILSYYFCTLYMSA